MQTRSGAPPSRSRFAGRSDTRGGVREWERERASPPRVPASIGGKRGAGTGGGQGNGEAARKRGGGAFAPLSASIGDHTEWPSLKWTDLDKKKVFVVYVIYLY